LDLTLQAAFADINIAKSTMPETVNEIIAETEIFATSAKGEKQQFHIAVGRPYCVDDVSWACSVRLEGLHNKLCDAVGVDSWQALGHAVGLNRKLLACYVEDGGKLYWEEGGEEITLNDLFPQLGASN
jgi:hypothetical protein